MPYNPSDKDCDSYDNPPLSLGDWLIIVASLLATALTMAAIVWFGGLS